MQLRAFVDELARCGLRDACTSPGSRNTPIVLSLAREPRLRCHSHIDERVAGFFALGLAKASGLPVAVTCTSGTAAAELLPAIIEAHEARVPLIVLTADRPPELRDVGAGQAIDQVKLYGDAVKWFVEVGQHDASAASLRWWRTLACRAYATAREGRPGVVHLNVPLREPLVVDEPLPGDDSGRPDGAPFVARRPDSSGAAQGSRELERLRALVAGAQRGVVVAGRHERATGLAHAAAEFAAAHGWPLLADPLSGARRGPAAISGYDALLRDDAFAAAQRPDVVLRVGDLPPSKPLRTWLAGVRDAVGVALDPEGAWQDPDAVLAESMAIDPAGALAGLVAASSAGSGSGSGLSSPAGAGAGHWLAVWRDADDRATAALGTVLDDAPLSEPWVARELSRALAADGTLFVASSMPVRDVESFWPALDAPPRVLCNRGANGIDGTVASALGVTAVAGGPVALLIGDVALAHDLGALASLARHPRPLTIVLVNNGGGGIFDFLPIARTPTVEPAVYAEHVGTPTGLDFERVAAMAGVAYARPATAPAFGEAVRGALAGTAATLIEVRTDRAENVALHARAWAAVRDAIRNEV